VVAGLIKIRWPIKFDPGSATATSLVGMGPMTAVSNRPCCAPAPGCWLASAPPPHSREGGYPGVLDGREGGTPQGAPAARGAAGAPWGWVVSRPTWGGP
jgi:hypothetical protein